MPDGTEQSEDTSTFAGGEHVITGNSTQCRDGFRQITRQNFTGTGNVHEVQSILGQLGIDRFERRKDLQFTFLPGLCRVQCGIAEIAIGFQLGYKTPGKNIVRKKYFLSVSPNEKTSASSIRSILAGC